MSINVYRLQRSLLFAVISFFLLVLVRNIVECKVLLPLSDQQGSGNVSNTEEICFYANDECPNRHIKFWFYKNESSSGELLNVLNLSHHNFEPHLPLTILIHGFNGSREISPNREIRPVLLEQGATHVISVDYERLVHMFCYFPWAIYNANVVSKCLAQLIDHLVEQQIYAREEIHIIGFSLGGQIAGLTANHARTQLNRITGLDPARPAFVTFNNDEKLDATDADFVDVIHTDPLLYGMLLPSGHADFYPNFGAPIQAGCSYWQEGRLINCNHFRAPLYYAESITSSTDFWSYNCGSWWEFLLQRCSYYGHLPLIKMGHPASVHAAGAYFLTTRTTPPFAKGIPIEFQHEVFQDPDDATNGIV